MGIPVQERMNAADAVLGAGVARGPTDRPAILSDDGAVTFAQLDQAACRLGRAFQALGLQPRDRILLLVDDRPEFFFTYLGAMKIGAVPVALNLRLASDELRFIIEDSGCKLIVIDPGLLPLFRDAAKALRQIPLALVATGRSDGLDSLADVMEGQPADLASVPMRPDDMALWMYTSGATGKPKAAIHLQESIPTVDRYLGPLYGVGPGDRVFCTSKQFFAFSLGHCLLAALRLGATAVLHAGWPSAAAVSEAVERFRPTLVFSVPTLYRNLLAEGFADRCAFRAVRHFIAAGERLPDALFRHWLAVTGQPILEGIGATETLVMFIGNRPTDYRPGSTGKALPATKLRLAGEAGGTIAEAGRPGVLWVRCPSLAAGYWKQDEKTAEAFRDGWYCTGDVFLRGPDGRYSHQGRADDMLKVSGQWVGPAEIEELVLQNPKVSEAAVIGVETADELTRLALCLTTGDPAVDRTRLEAELTETLTARLSVYKCPRRFVYLDQMPRTATGKLQRFKLRQG